MNKKNLLIFGNYGGINIGDEVILAGLISVINKKNWNIKVVSTDPAFTTKEYKVQSVPHLPFGFRSFFRFDWKEALGEIKNADLIMFGGGGLFQDREKRAFVMWSFFLKVCFWYKKRVILIGNSFDINQPKNIKKAEKLFKKVSFFSVRDKYSYDFLKQINVPEAKMRLATDCAFFLNKKQPEKGIKKPILFILHGELTQNHFSKLKSFKNYLKKKGEKIEFLAMQVRYSHDHDIARKLKIKCYRPKNQEEARRIIASAKFVVSSRLHGAILALISEVPFVAFSSMVKMKGFLKNVRLSRYFLEDDFRFEDLRDIYERSMQSNTKLKQKLKQRVEHEKEGGVGLILPDFF
jgi:polysaccharide pyruvyl transferase CsaB